MPSRIVQGANRRASITILGFRLFVLTKRVYRKYLERRPRRKDRAASDAPVAAAPRRIPRVIWIYWAQGEQSAPAIVKHCIASWRTRNSGWEVRVLDAQNIGAVIAVDDMPHGISFSHFADIARVRILAEYGGVWADATTYCVRPLDHWLIGLMQGGFFAFYRPHPDRLIASWFLASEPGGEIARMWWDRIAAYWSVTKKADHYLWLHYLFEWTVKGDPAFRRAWDRVPKVSADGPHLLRRCIEAGISPSELTRTAVEAVPLHKLTWKSEIPAEELRKWSIETGPVAAAVNPDMPPGP